jgi:DNA-binding NtrC family response regulator
MPHALIIEDDPNSLRGLTRIAQADGFTVDAVGTLAAARAILVNTVPDIVLVDVNLPDGIGLELLSELPQLAPGRTVPIVVMTGNATVESAIASLRLGVWDYLLKPVDVVHLRSLLARVPRSGDLHVEVENLRATLRGMGRFGDMVGRSPVMHRVYDLIAKVAPTEANVMIAGESGTGKEVAAHTLHQLSRRSKGPFVALNCGAIAPNLIESALFGHERGAFTGAETAHVGVFEQAGGGTLFLDEITEMPLDQQVKLLRILEARTFSRLGSKQVLNADFRLISATNRDPEAAVAAYTLRLDLYHRINTFPLTLPPLRVRGEDIILLATRFVEELNQAEGQNKHLSQACYPALLHYAWPGNVRELRNQLQRAFIMADQVINQIDLDLPAEPVSAEIGAVHEESLVAIAAGSDLAVAERRLIEAAVQRAAGVRSRAAQMLGISPKTLYNKLKLYESNP